ncbi:MAG: DNA repair protein RecO [Treponema sp.]|nr:DNA repair protein RecO [Treponema sp.]
MSQSLVTLGTVISIKPQGENNSSVCFLTQKEGIVYATLYGGRKSKLRSLVSPWNTGTVYFSVTNQSNLLKISDFDVKQYHLTFRESLVKSCAASLAAELAIKTKCAGSNEHCWALINGFLDGLEHCTNDEQSSLGLIRFLWRYLDLLGVQPQSNYCCKCETSSVYLEKGVFYSLIENGFLCSDCAGQKQVFFLNQEAINYLNCLSSLSPGEVRKIPLSKEAYGQLKDCIFYMIENACSCRLTSLQTGIGIL